MESNSGVNWRFVCIATVLIYLVTMVGGFLIGFMFAASGGPMVGGTKIAVLAVSNISIVFIGIVIVGAMTPFQRWKNISLVSLGIWLLSVSNIAIGVSNFSQWIFSLILYFFLAGVAGLLSMLVTGLIMASVKSTG